jgi:hypothetical protein
MYVQVLVTVRVKANVNQSDLNLLQEAIEEGASDAMCMDGLGEDFEVQGARLVYANETTEGDRDPEH